MTNKVSFTRKEIAFFIDALTIILYLDDKTKDAHGLTDKKIRASLFKLWRVFDASKGIIC
jgi:hypothetical protein